MGPVLNPVSRAGETREERRSTPVDGGTDLDRSQRLALAVLGMALLGACLVALHRRGSDIASAAAEDEPLAVPSYRVNVNEAGWAVLCLVPGIGETLSQRIVAYREANGAYRSLNELVGVSGIGRAKLREMAPFLTLGGVPGNGATASPGQRRSHGGVQAGQ